MASGIGDGALRTCAGVGLISGGRSCDAVVSLAPSLLLDSELLNAAFFSAFFSPAFLAASAPACLSARAIDGVSSFLMSDSSVVVDFEETSSLKVMWLSFVSCEVIFATGSSADGAGMAVALEGVFVVDAADGAGGRGAFEGVFDADADGVADEAAGAVDPICCFSSPYSFHSSTSSRSYSDD